MGKQFEQVGNAVPPLIAEQLAGLIYEIIISNQSIQKKKPRYRVQAVWKSSDGFKAMINGKILEPGGRFNDLFVDLISDKEVVLKSTEGKKTIVKVK